VGQVNEVTACLSDILVIKHIN